MRQWVLKNLKGTKVFALGGKIHNTGLVEVPMGTTLREQLLKKSAAVFLTARNSRLLRQADLPAVVFLLNIWIFRSIMTTLSAIGSMMGSGGLIVMDEDNCMVDIAKFFLEFTVDESCGKCTPCRIGTKRMYEMLDKITRGQGTLEDIDKLGRTVLLHESRILFADLGQTAPNPVLSTLHYFRDEYVAHVVDKKCPAGVCKASA